MTNRDQKLYTIVSDVLGLPVDEITEDCSPDTCEAWKSLMHLNLILAIESEYGISISPEDSLDLLSIGIIRTYLDEQGVRG